MSETLQSVIKENMILSTYKAYNFTESLLHSNLLIFLDNYDNIYSELERERNNILTVANTLYEGYYKNTLESLKKIENKLKDYNLAMNFDRSFILSTTSDLFLEYVTLYEKHMTDFQNRVVEAKNVISKYNFVLAAINSYKGDDTKRLSEMQSDLNRYKTMFDSIIRSMVLINEQINELLEKGLKKI